jgi:group I intron endonuclease
MDGTTSFPSSSAERSGVYLITSRVTGRSYAGSSARVFHRFQHHRKLLRIGAHHLRSMQEEWDEHGPGNFIFEIWYESNGREERLACEQQLIDILESECRLFNVLLYSDMKGSHPSASSLEKMKKWVPSPETRARMSAAKKGKPTIASKSSAAREKISASMRGSNHPLTSLTETMVIEIRRRLDNGEGVRALAREFDVSPTTISDIKNRKLWTHI